VRARSLPTGHLPLEMLNRRTSDLKYGEDSEPTEGQRNLLSPVGENDNGSRVRNAGR
jgi:hypothetical protein